MLCLQVAVLPPRGQKIWINAGWTKEIWDQRINIQCQLFGWYSTRTTVWYPGLVHPDLSPNSPCWRVYLHCWCGFKRFPLKHGRQPLREQAAVPAGRFPTNEESEGEKWRGREARRDGVISREEREREGGGVEGERWRRERTREKRKREAGMGSSQPSAEAFNDSWTYSSDIGGSPFVGHAHTHTYTCSDTCTLKNLRELCITLFVLNP